MGFEVVFPNIRNVILEQMKQRHLPCIFVLNKKTHAAFTLFTRPDIGLWKGVFELDRGSDFLLEDFQAGKVDYKVTGEHFKGISSEGNFQVF